MTQATPDPPPDLYLELIYLVNLIELIFMEDSLVLFKEF